jgi:hypothetical protein
MNTDFFSRGRYGAHLNFLQMGERTRLACVRLTPRQPLGARLRARNHARWRAWFRQRRPPSDASEARALPIATVSF